MKVCFDLDDFSPLNHRIDLLIKLRERYPHFKVTLFTTPWEIRLSPSTKGTPITEKQYKPWCDEVRGAVDAGWMEISIHGLTHGPREFEKLTHTEAKKRVIVAQKMFKNVGIKINNLFKAPYWLLSKDAKKAIEGLGFKVVEDGYYNFNIGDDLKISNQVIAHGHVQDGDGSNNGLDESFHRIIKLPADVEWNWLKDVI